MPLFLSDIDFIFPMALPLTNANTTFGYWFNFIIQDIVVTSYGLFYATFNTIFLIFAVHLLQELKTISNICKDVGKYEKNEIIQNIIENLNCGGSEEKRKVPNNSRQRSVLEPDETTLNHVIKDFHREHALRKENQVKSHILLDIIVEHHNEAFR